jgi:DNA-binding CsgD family transcriptional regulator
VGSAAEKLKGALQFLEAAYAWERGQEEWLQGVLDAAVRTWGEVAWACALFYDAADVRQFRAGSLVASAGREPPPVVLQRMSELPPEFVARTYRSLVSGFTRHLGGHLPPMYEELEAHGSVDIFGLNANDSTGLGCAIMLGACQSTIPAADALRFQRMAAHLSSAYRCRRRLQGVRALDSAEAILDENGRVLEASGPASRSPAQRALRETVLSIQRLRARRTTDDAIADWPPRVQTRWTLVDAFSRGGQRYIVARENLDPAGGLDILTERERQVVACAAMGKTNKEIAYDLGISHATARVLLSRAFARLGVHSHEELLGLVAVRALVGDRT